MKTEITLAICMYNAEKYIEETLACIKAQTMQDFHLLIVNDCSTDGSVECVKRFFRQNPRQYELVSIACFVNDALDSCFSWMRMIVPSQLSWKNSTIK